MGALTKKSCDPSVFSFDDLGAALVGVFGIGEQNVNRVEAVLLGMSNKAVMQSAVLFRILNNCIQLIVRQDILLLGAKRLIENVILHS